MIDCYEKIISYYEPGDRIFIFGFSRGAYTARCVANVMNLCGIPTKKPDGSPVPRYGPELRKIATDAVKYVYNHGTGYSRSQQPYLDEREEKGRRFRVKYGSSPTDGSKDVQGNVQPTFIGVSRHSCGAWKLCANVGSLRCRFDIGFSVLVVVVRLDQLTARRSNNIRTSIFLSLYSNPRLSIFRRMNQNLFGFLIPAIGLLSGATVT